MFEEKIIALLIIGAAVIAAAVIAIEKSGKLDRALVKWQIKHDLMDWNVFYAEDIDVPEDLNDVILLVNDK